MRAATRPVGLSGNAVDWVLEEHEPTEPLNSEQLSAAARSVIQNQINEGDTERIKLEWLPDGRVRLRATEYVGIVSLPGGLTIEIRPKGDETNLLEVLQYSEGVRADTLEKETRVVTGRKFIQALAVLFEAELREVLQRGLSQEYREQSGSEDYIRGRIEVQRQLQRQSPKPTKFECTYDELTRDTVLNQAVLFATTVLLRFVTGNRTAAALQRHKQVIQREVTLREVRASELEAVELSRLTSHYEDIYRLTKLILRSLFVENLHSGSRPTFSLLVDMNTVFEGVIQRGVQEVAKEYGFRGFEQASSSDNLVWGGSRDIRIRPDVLVKSKGVPLLVGDAKWKLDTAEDRSPSNQDIYQVISYQVAHGVPGILFYPSQDKDISCVYESQLEEGLAVVEVPTRANSGETYGETVRRAIRMAFNEVGVAASEPE